MSSRNNRNCNCKCNPVVTVTSLVTTATLTTLTIDRNLLGLECFFELRVPCALISTALDDSTISITDGTNTYETLNWLGNNLRADVLKDRCCCSCRYNVTVEAFVGHDPDHVSVLTKLC